MTSTSAIVAGAREESTGCQQLFVVYRIGVSWLSHEHVISVCLRCLLKVDYVSEFFFPLISPFCPPPSFRGSFMTPMC